MLSNNIGTPFAIKDKDYITCDSSKNLCPTNINQYTEDQQIKSVTCFVINACKDPKEEKDTISDVNFSKQQQYHKRTGSEQDENREPSEVPPEENEENSKEKCLEKQQSYEKTRGQKDKRTTWNKSLQIPTGKQRLDEDPETVQENVTFNVNPDIDISPHQIPCRSRTSQFRIPEVHLESNDHQPEVSCCNNGMSVLVSPKGDQSPLPSLQDQDLTTLYWNRAISLDPKGSNYDVAASSYEAIRNSPEMYQFVFPSDFLNMHIEGDRQKTFPKGFIGASIKRLAQSGFYFEDKTGETVCFSCGLRKRKWEPSEKIVAKVHLKLRPDCQQANFIDSRNVPINNFPTSSNDNANKSDFTALATNNLEKDSEISQETQGNCHRDAVPDQSEEPFSIDGATTSNVQGAPTDKNVPIHNTKPNQNLINTFDDGSSTDNFPSSESLKRGVQNGASLSTNYSENRPLENVTNPRTYPKRNFVDSIQTSFNTHRTNNTQTNPNTIQANGIQPNHDNSLENTSTTIPGSSTRSNLGNNPRTLPGTNTTDSQSITHGAQSNSCPDAIHSIPHLPAPTSDGVGGSWRSGGSIVANSDSVRGLLDISLAVSPEYAIAYARLASFETWPRTGVPAAKSMVIAGFFYLGMRDSVRCFYCGVTLKNWRQDDDPWITHVRFRFSCDYVRAVKGENFVCHAQVFLANGRKVEELTSSNSLRTNQAITATDTSRQPASMTSGTGTEAVESSQQLPADSHQAGGESTTAPRLSTGNTDRAVQISTASASALSTISSVYPSSQASCLPTTGPLTSVGRFPHEALGLPNGGPHMLQTDIPGFTETGAASFVGVDSTRDPLETGGFLPKSPWKGGAGAFVASSLMAPAQTQQTVGFVLANSNTSDGVETLQNYQAFTQASARESQEPSPTSRASSHSNELGGQRGLLSAGASFQGMETDSGTALPDSQRNRTQSRKSTVSREHPPARSTLTRDLSSDDERAYLQKLQQTNHRLRRTRTCRVCGDRAVDTIFLPCGHLCSCESCAATLRECCLCGDTIRGTAHVYLD